MKSYILFTLLLILPLQAFCDQFFVCDRKEVNECIAGLTKRGFKIKNIRYERLNDYVADAIITYE